MPAIDVDDYRKRYAKSLKGGPAKKGRHSTESVAGVAPADEVGATFEMQHAVATDRTNSVDERLRALRELAGLEFFGPLFAPYLSEWLAMLRTLARDKKATVRREALQQLALREDPFAREVLARGLEKPSEALVPEVLALQYLGHDSHGDAVPLAKKILRRATGAAREEALRILATDPGSAPMLERLMKDKTERSAVRRISAAALQDLDPERFEKAARRIVADDDDFSEIRSTTLTALALRSAGPPADEKLAKAVAELKSSSRSVSLKQSASRFLDARDRG
ncbi:MAG: hypothetical protein M3450_10845 [Actinomycetota bacterium]|nr:hypothetical protein [Actinomycetota bacterium]